jgi:hypothetical protein
MREALNGSSDGALHETTTSQRALDSNDTMKRESDDSVPPSGDGDGDGDRGRMEVNIQSLDGIILDEISERPSYPWVTATVTFAGSGNMTVASSSVCGVTGGLFVESEPVAISSPCARSPRLSAHWAEEKKKSGETQPHLTLHLDGADDKNSPKPLREGNRSAKFIKPDLDLSQTDSTVTEMTSSTCGLETPMGEGLLEMEEEEDCRSRSAVWSNTGAVLPEIIELYVRLRHEQDSAETYWDGVAFLVVYGHEGDRGTHVLELPIRKASFDPVHLSRKTSQSPSPLYSRMRLRPEASLTVQVKVVPGRPTPPTPVASSIIVAGPPSPRRALSQEAMMAELEPVLEMLRKNELLAGQMREARRRAMDVTVPHRSYADGLPPPDDDNNSFCTVPFLGEWTSFMNRVVGLVNNCDPSTTVNPKDDLEVDESSTIATRDSDRDIFGIQW